MKKWGISFRIKLKTIGIRICGAGILLFLLLICLANLFHYNYRMNADIASEALLGQVIWDSRQWIPNSWYPSTEVRIIGTANLSVVFYGLFGNLNLAMGLACISAVLWIIYNVRYLFREAAGGVNSDWIFMVFLLLALPADYSLLEILYLFAGYYAGHVAVLFFTLGVYGGSLRRKSFMRGSLVLSICLAFLLGMQGARGMLVIYGPLLAVEVLRQIYLIWKGSQHTGADWKTGMWVLGICLSNFLGSCLPVSVNLGFSRNIRKGIAKFWESVIPDITAVLGFDHGGMLKKVCLGILLLNAVYILFSILQRLWKKKELETLEWIYLVLCASPCMTALLVAFTTVESTGRYYFAFLIMLSMAVVMLPKQSGKCVIPVCAFVWIAVGYLSVSNFINLYVPMMDSKEPPETDFAAVVSFLEENGYSLGYATFENANTMTVISGGRVKVSPVASVEKMDICKWLSSTDWYPPNIAREQTTAYIVTESQMPDFEKFLCDKDGKLQEISQIGRFHIYISDYNYVDF